MFVNIHIFMGIFSLIHTCLVTYLDWRTALKCLEKCIFWRVTSIVHCISTVTQHGFVSTWKPFLDFLLESKKEWSFDFMFCWLEWFHNYRNGLKCEIKAKAWSSNFYFCVLQWKKLAVTIFSLSLSIYLSPSFPQFSHFCLFLYLYFLVIFNKILSDATWH